MPTQKLMGGCVLIGVVAGLGAAGFYYALEFASELCMGRMANYYPPGAGYEASIVDASQHSGQIVRWMLLIVPVIGGLASGLLIFCLAPEAEGHGTDAAIDAYHFKDGVVRARVPLVKAVASAITIGSGGSGGREGPIAQIGAGFGSVLATRLNMPAAQRRVLMAAGMAGGIGAIFHAPLAGALFAAEVMYRSPEQEYEVVVPGFVTSIVAYCVFGSIFGFHPLFVTPAFIFDQPLKLLPYLVLALVVSVGAIAYVKVFYAVRHVMFDRIRIPVHLKPALGGIAVGIIGFFLPEALGTGYGVVQACFETNIGTLPAIMQMPTASYLQGLLPAAIGPTGVAAAFLALVAVAKIGTTAFSIGSGGSGGVFGPAVVIGGALGGATGLVCEACFPALGIQPGAFALVGMAGFFAGAANTPVSTIIIVSEMTGNYNLLLPAMFVCMITYWLCRNFTLYERQLPSRLDSPGKMAGMVRTILERLTVKDALAVQTRPGLIVVPLHATLRDIIQHYAYTSQSCFPVVGEDQRVRGMIRSHDVRRLVTESEVDELVIARDLAVPIRAVTPEDSLWVALSLMSNTQSVDLIVLDPEEPDRPIGVLTRSDVTTAYDRQITLPVGAGANTPS